MSERTTSRRERGFTLVEILVVIAMITIVAGMAVARLRVAVDASTGASAVQTLRAVSSAQFAARDADGRFLPLADLVARRLLDPTFAASPVVKNNYTFDEQGAADAIVYIARPNGPSAGARRYRLDVATGIIRYSDTGEDPTTDSPALGAQS